MKKYHIVIFVFFLLIGQKAAAVSFFFGFDNFGPDGISADGKVVVGNRIPEQPPNLNIQIQHAYRWSQQNGYEFLDDLTGGVDQTNALGTSADGSTVVGQIKSPSSPYPTVPYRWTEERGMETLGDLTGGILSTGFARDVSADGSVIVGQTSNRVVYHWREGDDPTFIIDDAIVRAVSNDGNIAVGQKDSEAYRWTEQDGLVGLGYLSDDGWASQAWGISGDGNVIVGESSAEHAEAFRWSADEEMIGLGTLSPDYIHSFAYDASFDGSVIVGLSGRNLPNGRGYQEAFVWDEMHGMRSLRGLLEQYFGLDLMGYQISYMKGVSDDGLSFIGNSNMGSWYAQIDTPLTEIDYIPYLHPFPINIPHVSPYIVKKIVDTDYNIPQGIGKFTGEFGGAAVSRGKILFRGRGSDNQQGLYLDDSKTGAIDVIVDKSSTLPGYSFSTFYQFAIDHENVVYSANLTDNVSGSGLQGILAYNPTDGNFIIIDTSTPIPGGIGNFARFGGRGYDGIDIDENHLVFKGGGADGQLGIYISELNGFNIKLVADRNTLVPNSLNKFDSFMYSNIDDGGVSFLGRDDSNTEGIYYFDLSTETLWMIVDSNTKVVDSDEYFDDLNSPSSSGKKIAFSARQGVYVADTETGELLKIADKNTPVPDGLGTFTSFGRLAMDGEKVAFVGSSWYGSGIYVGDGNSLSAIITDLDKLDNKNIHSFSIASNTARDNFDDNQLVFEVDFIDGSNGIYLAGPKFVTIDIKPGSVTNCINNNGHGVIPVAILGGADFDCTQVDLATVSLEGMSIKMAGKSNKYLAHNKDVNHDGFDDLVVKIEDVDGAFTEGQTTAKLTGKLYEEYGGTEIEGTDNICIVP